LRGCAIQHEAGLSGDQRHGNARRRAKENQGSFMHDGNLPALMDVAAGI
jgi:hypothetical protein